MARDTFLKYSKSKDKNNSFIVYSIFYSGELLLINIELLLLDLNISSTL